MAKNQAPEIVSDGGWIAALKVLPENSLTVTTVVAKDANKDKLIYSISGTDAGLFNINPATGLVNFKLKPDFEAPSDAGHKNLYHINVSASDGKAVDTQAVLVAILNVNEVPTITSNGGGNSASIVVNENAAFVTTVHATDEDNPALKYSIVGGADAGKFGIDASSGAMRFLSAPDFEQPFDQNRNNVYEVVVAASDGKLKDTQALAIAVVDLPEQVVPGPGNDMLQGSDDYNYFDISAGGDDTVIGLGEYDFILGGAAFNPGDRIDGGDDTDLLQLTGDYSAGMLIGRDTLRNVEYIDPQGAYDYNFTFKDDFLADGQHVEIRGAGVAASNSMVINAAAETNVFASYSIWGGAGNDFLTGGAGSDQFHLGSGGKDTVRGGGGSDLIEARASFTADDDIDGGPGNNGLSLSGDYSNGVVLGPGNFKNMSYIIFESEAKYSVSTTDGILGPNQVLEVYAGFLGSSSSLIWDGSAETDASASFNITGGAGMDVLIGGAGNDSFQPGGGSDRMTGGAGRDTFEIHQIAEQDIIMDFTAGAGGDVLRIGWLLNSFNPATSSDFVRLTEAGADTILSTDRDGKGSDYQFQDAVRLVGVTGLDVETLIAEGNLVTVP